MKRALLLVVVLCASVACPSLRTYWRPSAVDRVVRAVPYGDAAKQQMDLYAPQGAANAPLVVFVHGGTWSRGDRDDYEWATGLYGNVGAALADRGIAVAIPSYRLWPDATIETMLDDVAAAVRVARDHAAAIGADPQRVFLAGHSAGAHLVALLATKPGAMSARGVDPSWIRGVVALSAPLDAARVVERSKNPAARGVFPHAPTQRARSPLTYLADSSLPWLFLIGADDYKGLRLDWHEARNLRLRTAQFVEIPRASHADMVLDFGAEDDPIADHVARFVHRYE